jgi:cyclic pyranopterin phosphate synthase
MTGCSPTNINYLRVSIIDRCNLKCLYCLPRQGWTKLPAAEILSYEEFLRLIRVAAQAGVRKIRVTGGEPLMRRGVVDFLARLSKISGITEVCLTTNGLLLADMAEDLWKAGLRHLNVSLDTLKEERYREITGEYRLHQVLAGVERALCLGFQPLKINFVVLKGLNDDEVHDFAELARTRPLQVRFIEFMPTTEPQRWARHFLPMAEVRQRLADLGTMKEVPSGATAGPARIVRPPGFTGTLGFISSVSEHSCSRCNRLRLTAAGRLRPCLFAPRELDLKTPLRQGAGDEELHRLFLMAMQEKTCRPPLALVEPSQGTAMIALGG